MTHILVVEDSMMMARVLERRLEHAGFHVTVANDGWQAWRILCQDHVDAMVVDYALPGMNGEQLCAHVRAENRYGTLPIILVTGRGYEIDIASLRQQYELTAVFLKPFSLNDLTKVVSAAISMKPGVANHSPSLASEY